MFSCFHVFCLQIETLWSFSNSTSVVLRAAALGICDQTDAVADKSVFLFLTLHVLHADWLARFSCPALPIRGCIYTRCRGFKSAVVLKTETEA